MYLKESILLIILGGLLYLHIGPYAHGMFAMGVGVVALIIIGIYAGFVWKEFPADEREEHIHGKAHKIAFLSAVTILTIGITVEYLTGHNDVWLLATLIALLGGKSIGSLYAERTS